MKAEETMVVTTPTGHIGSQVVANLLAANEAGRVIAHDLAMLAAEARAKVEIVPGSSDDESVLRRYPNGLWRRHGAGQPRSTSVWRK
jgi:nucleoside-diphosphate-sugar epimerase